MFAICIRLNRVYTTVYFTIIITLLPRNAIPLINTKVIYRRPTFAYIWKYNAISYVYLCKHRRIQKRSITSKCTRIEYFCPRDRKVKKTQGKGRKNA